MPPDPPKRSLDPATYTNWDAPLTVDDTTPTESDGSILIKGCKIRSMVAGAPAIRIKTTKQVRVRSCVLMGTGITSGAHGLVLLDWGDGNVDVEDTIFFSRRLGVSGAMPARAVALPYTFTSFRFVHNYRDGTAGLTAGGDSTAGKSSIEIRENKVKNLDGRFEDPAESDGVVHSNHWGAGGIAGFTPVQFLQLFHVNAPLAYAVDDNEVINNAGESRVEDIVSLYESTGTASVKLAHRHNLFVGTYVYDWAFKPESNNGFWGNNVPSQGSTAANAAIGRWDDSRGLGNSSGGGICGDGNATSGIPQQYAVYDGTTLVNIFNYGHQIAGGENATISNCIILNSGYIRNLPGIKSSWGVQPIQAIFYPDPSNPDLAWWGGHDIHDIVTGERWFSPLDNIWHEEQFFITTKIGVTVTNITNKPGTTPQDEEAAIAAHRATWTQAGKIIGPLS